MNKLDTLSETLEGVAAEGYTHSFKLEDGKLRCLETKQTYAPSNMSIVNHYRFEGSSNPDDMSVLYVLECDDGTKGTIVDAYGAYAAPGLDDFIKQIRMNESDPAH